MDSSLNSGTTVASATMGEPSETNNRRPTSRSRSPRTRMSVSFSKRLRSNSARRHAEIDDEEGKAQFFLTLLFQSIEDSACFFASTILFLVTWATICAYGAYELRKVAAADPG
ncbi:hypothetical protein ACHAWC_003053, partial [Mediolabrus comicus]